MNENEFFSLSDLLNTQEKEKVKNVLLDFILRVAQPGYRSDVEILILPDIIRLVL